MEQNIKFSKTDFWAGLIIGEISAWLIIAVINNLGFQIPLLVFLPVIFPVLCIAGLFISFFIGKKIPVIYQIGKFVLVGGFNTLVDWGILAFLIFFFRVYFLSEPGDILLSAGVIAVAYYSLYKAASFLVAVGNSYFWNKFWTFKRESSEDIGKEFGQFLIVTFIGFLLNVFIASMIFKYIAPFGGLTLDQWGIISAVFATAVSMVWNFLGYKFMVFGANKAGKIK